MKTYKTTLLLLPIIALSLTACNNTDSPNGKGEFEYVDPNTNKKSRNFYQLLVYSFADSNGDGIGDFKGIVDKLDYLSNLGIEGLWLSPVLASNAYHSYDVTDYYSIKSVYEVTIGGTKYDYRYLLDECHKRDIVVIMDLVMNHTAYNHPWVTSHPSWYAGSSKDVFYGMKDLNYDNQEVQAQMKEVGKYWLERGFDGFRLDAAMWLYNDTGKTSNDVVHSKNFTYWNSWCNEMRSKKADCYIIGEVLNVDHDLAYQYAQAGFDSTFDFNVRTHVESAIKNPSYDYVSGTSGDINRAASFNSNYILGRTLSNHDIGRFTQQHIRMESNDEGAHYVTSFNDIRLANALNVMMRGNTFIYYGDELGLVGNTNHSTSQPNNPYFYYDMHYRTPMPWKSETTNPLVYFVDGSAPTVYSSTSTIASNKTADDDMNDENSLYGSVSKLLNIKKNSDAIKNGTLAKLTNLPTGLKGYTLSNASKRVSFIYNPTNSPIEFEISENVLYSTDTYTNKVSISSKGFIVTTN